MSIKYIKKLEDNKRILTTGSKKYNNGVIKMNLTKEQFIDLHEEAVGTRMITALGEGDTFKVWDYVFKHKTGITPEQNGYLKFQFKGIVQDKYQIEFQ